MAKRRKRKEKRGLARAADKFAMLLIWEASGGKIGIAPTTQAAEEPVENPVSFRDRRALLDSITKLLGDQPEENTEEEDGLDEMRKRLSDDRNGGTLAGGTGDSDGAE